MRETQSVDPRLREMLEDLRSVYIESLLLEAKLAGRELLASLRLCYSPDQPRVPAGSSEGGRWTSGGGDSFDGDEGARDWRDRRDRYRVDLREHEGGRHRGHTIDRHVDKSDEYLFARLREASKNADGTAFGFALTRSSFLSLGEANRFVGLTLAANADVVDRVVEQRGNATIHAEFYHETGKEAYLEAPGSVPIIRPTYWVTVFLRQNPMMPEGYQVVTAYTSRFAPPRVGLELLP